MKKANRVFSIILFIALLFSLSTFLTSCAKLTEDDVYGSWYAEWSENGVSTESAFAIIGSSFTKITQQSSGSKQIVSGHWRIINNKLRLFDDDNALTYEGIYTEYTWKNGKFYNGGHEYTKVKN